MENWNKISECVPDKEVNKTVIFAVPKSTVKKDGDIKETSGTIFYTWDNLPSLDWLATVGGIWIETPEISFV